MPRAQPSNGETSLETPIDDAGERLEETRSPQGFSDSALFDPCSDQHVPMTIWSDAPTPVLSTPTDGVKASKDL